MKKAQAMLDALRIHYLQDLPIHIDELEQLLLVMDVDGYDLSICRDLYRRIHSLKGSGGTYGMHTVTDVCHPFEDLLSHLIDQPDLLHHGFTTTALEYIDLLRQITTTYCENDTPGDEVQLRLQKIRHFSLQKPHSAIVVESSDVVVSIIKDVLKQHRFRVEVLEDGYLALGRILSDQFDLVITGLETHRLNGLALISAAQRSSNGINKGRPITSILITTTQLEQDANLPSHVLKKDAQFRENFARVIAKFITHS